MSDTNGAQIEFWNGVLGRQWVDDQERLDHIWQVIGDPAFVRAKVRPGERVDVGCGCGATALDLATVGIGRRHRHLGSDGRASARVDARAGRRQLEFVWADASTYAFAGNANLVEQDDMDNCQGCTQSGRGVVARRYHLSYEMSLGHERFDAGLGAPVSGYRYSESNHRGFYRRWAELMTDG